MSDYTVTLTVNELESGGINYTAVTVDNDNISISGEDVTIDFKIATPDWTWMPNEPYGFYMFNNPSQFSTGQNPLSNNNQTLTIEDADSLEGTFYYCCCLIKQSQGSDGPVQAAATDPAVINIGR